VRLTDLGFTQRSVAPWRLEVDKERLAFEVHSARSVTFDLQHPTKLQSVEVSGSPDTAGGKALQLPPGSHTIVAEGLLP